MRACLVSLSTLLAFIVGILALPTRGHAWESTIEGDTPSTLTLGQQILTASDGDILIGGTLGNLDGGVATKQIAIVKLSHLDGHEIWRRALVPGTFGAMANASGSVVVVGQDATNTRRGVYAAKISEATGGIVWSQTFVGKASQANAAFDDRDGGHAVALSTSGDVIVGGTIHDFTLADHTDPTEGAFLVLRLEGAGGNEVWRQELFDGVFGDFNGSKAADHLAFDQDGNIIAAGPYPLDIFILRAEVAKLDQKNGDVLWNTEVKVFSNLELRDLATDPQGDVFVVGQARQLFLNENLHQRVVRKLSGADGSVLWDLNAEGFGTSAGYDRSLVVDGAGDPIVCSATETLPKGIIPRSQFAVTKFDGATGTVRWLYQIPVKGIHFDECDHLAIDAAGNLTATGFQYELAKESIITPLVVKLGSNGLPAATHATDHFIADFVTDARGDVTYVSNEPGFDAMFATNLVPVVSGKQLTITDNALKPSKRAIKVDVKDPSFTNGAAGSPSDPSIGGATLLVENPTSHEQVSIDLPAAGWKAGKDFKFNGKDLNVPCKAGIKKGGWSVACTGDQIAFTLDEPSQGSIAVKLTYGTERSCALFGGEIKKDLPNAGKKGGVFQAKNPPPPPTCD